jgi:uncharacterized protein
MDAQQQRDRNRAIFIRMLDALGRKDWDTGFACMSEDVLCDWPYLPIADMPHEMRGRERIREFFSVGQQPFAGLNYRVDQIYEQLDPALLIAEYHSDSRHIPSGQPYSNRYLGILRFENDQVAYWREYINPMTIKAIFDNLPPA